MITAREVRKRFGRVRAVDGVTFTLEPGQALALWGSNGAGKTTLIRCLLGIVRFDGLMTIDGRNVRRAGKQTRSLIGYVPQELAFHDYMRLGGAMAFFARLRGVDGARARDLLARVGLDGHERKRVRDLSGGMKQRLALAVALLSDPPLIVLDEPTSNLDAAGRSEVVETLRALRRDGKTIVFASHRPDEVIALADRVLVMERGRVVADTTPAELWPGDAGVQTVRLHLRRASEQDAADVLRSAGHAVHLNGRGLCVAVERDQKAAPISLLAEARLEVRDFEILDDLVITRETTR
ncbi:MAG: ABC transporter ATP-binding protein [Phycisphaerales bacterium]